MLFLLLITGIIVSYFIFRTDTLAIPVTTPKLRTNDSIRPGQKKQSLFVPYWTLTSDIRIDDKDILLYFGVTPGASGLNKEDQGYSGLTTFTSKAGDNTTYLTLRMLDSKQNFTILENNSLQHALITDTIQTAKANGFTGVVLDLEVSALPFASVIDQISAFNKKFYNEAKKENLHYAVALYGDTFFRIRPFDVKSIGESSDEIMIMAYDMHKSRGNPGPNFPLGGKQRYGYDYTKLISQFSDAVPQEKLTVIFGLFGYDWEIDDKKNMVTHGEPLSYNQIEDRFLTDCAYTLCLVNRDPLSSETSITYTDNDGKKHLVWFEDPESVAKKQEYLRTQGIQSYSFWAYSYY